MSDLNAELAAQRAFAELLRQEKPRLDARVDPYVEGDERMVNYGARLRGAVPLGKNATLGVTGDIGGARGRGFSERPAMRGYGVDFEYRF